MANRVEVSDDWRDHVEQSMEQLFADRLGPDIAGDAKRYCPERTGALKDSIEHHMEGDTLIVSASGGADGRTYAAYVELGTRPHEIRPRDARALFWEGADHPVAKVNHPGTHPQPFLRPALYQQRGD